MSKVSTWWTSWGFGRERHRPETDFADMGTAFGLDASFGREERPAGSAAAGASTAPDRPRDAAGAEGQETRESPARS